MKSVTLLILASAASASAQLNRIADRQLLRRGERHSNDNVELVMHRSKASKAPTATPVVAAKTSKPPHTHGPHTHVHNANAAETDSHTHMPSASPSRASEAAFGDDAFDIDIITSLSMETVDSVSLSMDLDPSDPEFGEWSDIEFSDKTMSLSLSMSVAVDPEFNEWDNTEGFEWTGESMSMSL